MSEGIEISGLGNVSELEMYWVRSFVKPQPVLGGPV